MRQDNITDEILLEGMVFYGYHGVNPEEQALGQRFIVDVAITADLREAGASDDINATVSYAHVFKVVRSVVENQRFDLIEALAETIATSIFQRFERVDGITVTVRKPGVAIKGSILDSAGIRIRRKRLEAST